MKRLAPSRSQVLTRSDRRARPTRVHRKVSHRSPRAPGSARAASDRTLERVGVLPGCRQQRLRFASHRPALAAWSRARLVAAVPCRSSAANPGGAGTGVPARGGSIETLCEGSAADTIAGSAGAFAPARARRADPAPLSVDLAKGRRGPEARILRHRMSGSTAARESAGRPRAQPPMACVHGLCVEWATASAGRLVEVASVSGSERNFRSAQECWRWAGSSPARFACGPIRRACVGAATSESLVIRRGAIASIFTDPANRDVRQRAQPTDGSAARSTTVRESPPRSGGEFDVDSG